jgi:DNA-binding GntR family transcriptional regulator
MVRRTSTEGDDVAERQDRGTTSDAYVIAGSGDAWSAEVAAQGRVGTQRLLGASIIDPPESVRVALGLRTGDQVVARSRLMMVNDRPVEIASSYYPAAIAAGTPLAEQGKIRGGAIAALAALGHSPADVFEQITARWPDAEEAEVLQVEAREPLLVLSRTNLDAAGRPVEFAVNRMVARLSEPIAYRMRVSPA